MKEIYENTWAESDAGVRIFLLAGEKEALVIDTGMNGLDVRAMAEAHTGLPYHAKERVSREVIPLLTEGAEKILAGTLDGPEIEVHGTLIRSVDAGVCHFLIGRKE